MRPHPALASMRLRHAAVVVGKKPRRSRHHSPRRDLALVTGTSVHPRLSKPRGPARTGRSQPMEILHAIGSTSLVQLRKVVPTGCADIFVKLEWENPTGSLKDRMARAVISR